MEIEAEGKRKREEEAAATKIQSVSSAAVFYKSTTVDSPLFIYKIYRGTAGRKVAAEMLQAELDRQDAEELRRKEAEALKIKEENDAAAKIQAVSAMILINIRNSL